MVELDIIVYDDCEHRLPAGFFGHLRLPEAGCVARRAHGVRRLTARARCAGQQMSSTFPLRAMGRHASQPGTAGSIAVVRVFSSGTLKVDTLENYSIDKNSTGKASMIFLSLSRISTRHLHASRKVCKDS